jgi:hypothetical protein
MTFPRDAQVNKCAFPTAVKFLADLAGVANG